MRMKSFSCFWLRSVSNCAPCRTTSPSLPTTTACECLGAWWSCAPVVVVVADPLPRRCRLRGGRALSPPTPRLQRSSSVLLVAGGSPATVDMVMWGTGFADKPLGAMHSLRAARTTALAPSTPTFLCPLPFGPALVAMAPSLRRWWAVRVCSLSYPAPEPQVEWPSWLLCLPTCVCIPSTSLSPPL